MSHFSKGMAHSSTFSALLLSTDPPPHHVFMDDLRNYQKVLAKIAEDRNVIACLPTGAGKTLISVELSKHFISRVNQKIIFLAPTVPLTKQQLSVFEKHFSCTIYTGGHPIRSRQDFLSKTSAVDVVFLTSEMFRAGLEKDFIKLQDISLLILDECHHSVKKNPMNLVMKMYREKKAQGEVVPRILGLTATILKKNISPSTLDHNIAKAEQLLDSVAVTYENYDEVLRFSTSAQIRVIPYTTEKMSDFFVNLVSPIQEVLTYLVSLPEDITPFYSSRFSLRANNILGDEIKKDFKRILIGILDAKDFGKIGTIFASVRKLKYLEEVTTKKSLTGLESTISLAINTSLKELIFMAVTPYSAMDQKMRVERWASPKIRKIFQILSDYRSKVNTSDELCALLFVTSQHLSYCLYDIIKEWIKSDVEERGFIKPGLVVGAVTPKQVPVSERITRSRQQEVVERFRRKELNVVITTSILEEGIDVPSCNLIIRLEPLTSYVSMIQSMGRARKSNAHFYVLTEETKTGSTESTVTNFDEVNETLTDFLIKRMESLKVKGTHSSGDV